MSLLVTAPTSCSLLLVALAIQEVVSTAGAADLLKILLSEGKLRVEAGDRAPPAAATMSGCDAETLADSKVTAFDMPLLLLLRGWRCCT
jgi:hypothetical protein